MRAAHTFRRNGINVVQSDFYFDFESETHREIDLVARIPLELKLVGQGDVPAYLCPVLECKSSPGKPWVLFLGGVQLHPVAKISQRFVLDGARKYWSAFAHRCEDGRVPPRLADYLPSSQRREPARMPLFEIEDEPAYSAVRSSLGKSREDVAYSAMMGVSKAAHGVANRYPNLGNMALHIAVPVIVVDSPIFTCKLSDDGGVELERVRQGTVVWKNQVHGHLAPHSIIKIVDENTSGPKLAEHSYTRPYEFLHAGRGYGSWVRAR
ncbi:hypothetical protein JBE04_33685 [Streptomyces sp. PRKS01-29]|nr:hypothetical protein [Streptomyces sabulosicollis]MBI0299279.1 hypothetical protein [Streptomyces sabulosicollis]